MIDVQADYTLRGQNLDAVFAAGRLCDTAIDAVARANTRFDSAFPGWKLYRRIVSGSGLFDRDLEAWAILSARALSRATKINGRAYISEASRQRSGWVAQAGRDALDFAIYGRYPAGLTERAARFGVSARTYQAIRDPVARAMWCGVANYQSVVHDEFWRVRREERGNKAKSGFILDSTK